MRKILLGIIIILLIVLGVTMVTKGIGIANFKIQSMSQIEDANKDLKAKIEEANRLIDTNFPNKLNDLTSANNNMQKDKKEYLEFVNKSSSEQILAAKTLRSYAIEFLWTKLGTHAREEGVNLTFEIGSGGSSGGSNLNFTVEGSYIAITNFVYAIENDTDLDFRIQNFKLLPNNNEILKATFTVSGVTIQGNTAAENHISDSSDSSQSSNDNNGSQNQESNNNTSNAESN